MREVRLFAFFVCTGAVFLAAGSERELAAARARLAEVRRQVEAGVTPGARVVEAEEQVNDAEDAALLERTMYGSEMSEEQIQPMLAAVERRLDRRRKTLDAAKLVVEAGGASRLSLSAPLEDFDAARKEADLAESRARLVREIAEMARAELTVEPEHPPDPDFPLLDRFAGKGQLTIADLVHVENAFARKFSKALPISANGETSLHRTLGFDHRDRVDVALHPDEAEGVWLRRYLVESNIPFLSFRHFVPGKATGAHIHIGPQSARIPRADSGS